MRERLPDNRNRKLSCSVAGGLALLFLLGPASIRIVHAQSKPILSETRNEAHPYVVERSRIVQGKRDPRVRFDLLFGEARANCTAWSFETSAQPNGRAIFELKQPVDANVVLKLDSSPQHIEFVLGDADCNYRVRIERIK